MERIRLKTLAATCTNILLAATLAAAASLPEPEALKARFFADSPATVNTPAPPAALGAPVDAPAEFQALSGNRAEPDWSFTPGRLCTADDPDFKEYRYAERIPYCNRHVTKDMKLEVAAHYGIAQSDWRNYEFDHLIPLAIGGDSHVDNLWPQPRGNPDGSDDKDKLEYDLFLQMQAGTITQAEAVKRIYDWFRSAHPEFASKLPAQSAR
ncbi:MAG: hypothetical protein HY077_16060 [Elusimicrobia bacterium]|nr:hypothetical protein [Elusimicrobiota bacterium]